MMDLAIGNIPMQEYRRLYPIQLALQHGTMFMELEKPWCPCANQKGGDFV